MSSAVGPGVPAVMLRPISLMPPSAVTRNRRRSGDLAGKVYIRFWACWLTFRSQAPGAHVGGQRRSAQCRGHLGQPRSPTSMPCSLAAADNVTCRWLIALHSGATAMLILRAVAISQTEGGQQLSKLPGCGWAITLMKPVAPWPSQGRLSVVAE